MSETDSGFSDELVECCGGGQTLILTITLALLCQQPLKQCKVQISWLGPLKTHKKIRDTEFGCLVTVDWKKHTHSFDLRDCMFGKDSTVKTGVWSHDGFSVPRATDSCLCQILMSNQLFACFSSLKLHVFYVTDDYQMYFSSFQAATGLNLLWYTLKMSELIRLSSC